MGLDWCATARVDEHGNEISAIEHLGGRRLSRDDPDSIERFGEIARTHVDAALAGETNATHAGYWLRPIDELITDNLGQMLPPPDGNIPACCSGGSFVAGPASWRGKRLDAIADLDPDLLERAYEDFDASEAIAFAARLREAAEVVADPDDRATLAEAADFLAFWGAAGHGIHAWY